jgi:hypothetical protein
MELPRLFQTAEDVERFVAHVGLTADERRVVADEHDALDASADDLLGWWLHLAQDGPGRNVLAHRADGEVDQDALTAARPKLQAWLATTSRATYDAAWLEAQRPIARQLQREPHERSHGVDGWMALLPFFALVIEALPQIFPTADAVVLGPLRDAWRKIMQIHLTAWVHVEP